MHASGKEEYKCNLENAELGSWLAGPLHSLLPLEKKKSLFLKPEAGGSKWV
jgi:hypothetical protein